ncbi:MAG TPA: hypothetical protein VG603_00540 [Chitinophagales bacterium]|nr:hypothetical protein [Chitinophagales bacterium]
MANYDSEPQPELMLSKQLTPKQKITLKRIPNELYLDLKTRANKLGKKVPTYCRIVLEHASKHRNDYKGKFRNAIDDEDKYAEEINIPISSKQFIKDLEKWNPFGDGKKSEIAINILRKHTEVRTW